MAEVFLDAAYAIALATPRDLHHQRAVDLARWIDGQRIQLVTTRGVTLEIGNALAMPRHRAAATALLTALEQDPRVEIQPLSETLWQRGFELFQNRPDKEWSVTDCISFVVMQDRALTSALTTDHHFLQAGFRALLLDDLPPRL